jgi:hypothetical protein
MKKVAKVTGRELCYLVLECPFCQSSTTENPTMPWCVNCRTEYYEGREDSETGGRRIVFDDKRKTPRFAFAKALNAAGGMRIGKKEA